MDVFVHTFAHLSANYFSISIFANMNSSLARNCLLATLAFQAVVSITTIGLKITSYKFIKAKSGILFDIDLSINNTENSLLVSALPQSLYISALNLVVAASVISLVTAAAVSTFTFCAWSDRKRVRYKSFYLLSPSCMQSLTPHPSCQKCIVPPLHVFLTLILNALLSFITLATVLAVHARSANINRNANDTGTGGEFDSGTFDLETWTCSMATFATDGIAYALHCHLERAAMGTVIVGFILALVAVGLAACGLKSAKRRWGEAIEMKKVQNAYYHEDDDGDSGIWD